MAQKHKRVGKQEMLSKIQELGISALFLRLIILSVHYIYSYVV